MSNCNERVFIQRVASIINYLERAEKRCGVFFMAINAYPLCPDILIITKKAGPKETRFLTWLELFVHGSHVGDQIQHFVGVADFVIVPRHDFHEGIR